MLPRPIINTPSDFHAHILAWQISAFLDISLDVINTLDLARRLSPSKERLVGILQAAGFDVGAWRIEVADLLDWAENEAATIKGQVGQELIDIEVNCLTMHLINQSERLHFQELAGQGWAVHVRNTDIRPELIDPLRKAMLEHLPNLRALDEIDSMGLITPAPAYCSNEALIIRF